MNDIGCFRFLLSHPKTFPVSDEDSSADNLNVHKDDSEEGKCHPALSKQIPYPANLFEFAFFAEKVSFCSDLYEFCSSSSSAIDSRAG